MDPAHIPEIVASFGLLGMLGIALAEKFTPVVPSYVILVLLGMMMSSGPALAAAVLATGVGSLGGTMIWYAIGRALGGSRVEGAVARFGKYVFFSPDTYRRLAGAYRRSHFWVTLIGQTVPVARIYLALPAGVFHVQSGLFAVAAGLGIVLWNTSFLALGYLLRGSGYDPLHVGFWMPVGLLIAELSLVLLVRRRGNGAPLHRHERSISSS